MMLSSVSHTPVKTALYLPIVYAYIHIYICICVCDIDRDMSSLVHVCRACMHACMPTLCEFAVRWRLGRDIIISQEISLDGSFSSIHPSVPLTCMYRCSFSLNRFHPASKRRRRLRRRSPPPPPPRRRTKQRKNQATTTTITTSAPTPCLCISPSINQPVILSLSTEIDTPMCVYTLQQLCLSIYLSIYLSLSFASFCSVTSGEVGRFSLGFCCLSLRRS